MQTWYFTFGSGHRYEGYCQPIMADSFEKAREIMFDLYGDKWGFQYSENQWNEMKNDKNRYWEMEIELPVRT